MKSLFLAALAALAFFSSSPASAQQYRDSYYSDSHNGAAHVIGALIDIAAHSSHDRRSNYYGGSRYARDRHYGHYNFAPRYDYAPRYRSSYRYNNRYNSYPAYRGRTYYHGHHHYRGRHHGRGH